MTIRPRSELSETRPLVDLGGPDGNAFALMAMAKKWSKQLGLDGNAIMGEMMSGNYDHLLEVLESHFGEHVDFYR